MNDISLIVETTITSYSRNNVRYICSSALMYCNSLSVVDLPNCIEIEHNGVYECRNLSSVSIPNCVTIKDRAFASCFNLLSVSLPNCRMLTGGFFSCISLSSVYAPLVKYLSRDNGGVGCFGRCYNLSSADFPAVVSCAGGTFSYCSNLTSVSMPECALLRGGDFSHCYSLSEIYLPKCSFVGGSTFCSCSNLINAFFPNLITMGSPVFANCVSLKNVDLGMVNLIAQSCFQNCYALSYLSLPKIMTGTSPIGSYAFANCSALTTLVVGVNVSASVVGLANINAFSGTPMSDSALTGSYGSIYVPSWMVDKYKTATNWVTYADRITSLDNLPTQA